MQIVKVINPNVASATDIVTQGETTTWNITCNVTNAGATVVRDLTGWTDVYAVVYDDLGNPVLTATTASSPSLITVTNAPGADGKLTLKISGPWLKLLQPGNFKIEVTVTLADGATNVGTLVFTLKADH